MKKRNKKHRVPTIFLILLFLAGIGLFCYPFISNCWNTKTQSRVIADYQSAAALPEKDYGQVFEEAKAYNQAIFAMGSPKALSGDHPLDGYEEMLDIAGSNVMGIIHIEKIGVSLPIYHGTSADVLSSGAGHLEGSSLPIGGESTHAVITGHTGLPTARLFTRLDQLEIGDVFTITVMDHLLTYEVDQILVVEPADLDELYIKEGEDYCTLVTCTPYGINSHRLLVRGRRTEDIVDTSDSKDFSVIFWEFTFTLSILAEILIFIKKRKRKKID